MSEKCKWLHESLEELPLVRYPFERGLLPRNGIYFFYEKGEIWGHGGKKLRIVRVGTHRGHNFRRRISDHFLLNENRMLFDRNKPKPSDGSIFRKNIGRALLNKNNDMDYLETWNKSFRSKRNMAEFSHQRNIEKERALEQEITRIIRENFSFKFIILENEHERIGSGGLESRLIGTLARCEKCRPSPNWLGHYSPEPKIRESGLWLVQHLGAEEIDDRDIALIEQLVRETKKWIEHTWPG